MSRSPARSVLRSTKRLGRRPASVAPALRRKNEYALLWWLLCLAIFFRGGAGGSVCGGARCVGRQRGHDATDFREAVRQFDETFAPRLM